MTHLTLVIDTETSGLMRKNVPLDHPSQPHIVELAAVVVDDRDVLVHRISNVVRPDGWFIEPEATARHGITDEYARENGVELKHVLYGLRALVDKSNVIVGHNMEFERQMIRSELARGGWQGEWWNRRAADMRCTMELATPIMKIPGTFGDYQWPSLERAASYFYPDLNWKSVHRANGDALACLKVWRAVQPKEPVDGLPHEAPQRSEA